MIVKNRFSYLKVNYIHPVVSQQQQRPIKVQRIIIILNNKMRHTLSPKYKKSKSKLTTAWLIPSMHALKWSKCNDRSAFNPYNDKYPRQRMRLRQVAQVKQAQIKRMLKQPERRWQPATQTKNSTPYRAL
jgi:hypothetical protein